MYRNHKNVFKVLISLIACVCTPLGQAKAQTSQENVRIIAAEPSGSDIRFRDRAPRADGILAPSVPCAAIQVSCEEKSAAAASLSEQLRIESGLAESNRTRIANLFSELLGNASEFSEMGCERCSEYHSCVADEQSTFPFAQCYSSFIEFLDEWESPNPDTERIEAAVLNLQSATCSNCFIFNPCIDSREAFCEMLGDEEFSTYMCEQCIDRPEPTPTPTPTPTTTPTPTMTPEPSPTPICTSYVMEVIKEGANGVPKDGIFRPTEDAPSCLSTIYEDGYRACSRALKLVNKKGKKKKHKAKKNGRFLDDCIAKGWFLRANNNYPKGPLKPNECTAKGKTGVCTDGTFYFDENCNSIDKPETFCDAGDIFFRSSPISLVWEDDYDVDAHESYVSFPLNPLQSGKWYAWKASAKAPLLVYDPEHSGTIVSATQLFGEWTFGGKLKFAMAKSETPNNDSLQPTKWSNGFEALGSLDSNKDGVLSGQELAPLGLWFDNNQDGVSQKGEVVPLSERGVYELGYRISSSDPFSGTLYATNAFKRFEDGKAYVGTLVDWYGDSATTQSELIRRRIALSSLQSTNERHAPKLDSQASSYSTTKGENIEEISLSDIEGIWQWETLNSADKIEHSNGLFVFSLDERSRLRGTSILEIRFPEGSVKASRMIHTFNLHGRVVKSAEKIEVFFTTQEATKSRRIENHAVLDSSKMSLTGETTAVVKKDGRWVSIRYRWQATKKHAPNT